MWCRWRIAVMANLDKSVSFRKLCLPKNDHMHVCKRSCKVLHLQAELHSKLTSFLRTTLACQSLLSILVYDVYEDEDGSASN